MDEKFTEIILKSAEVFMRYGLRSVTMDDVARELKVSKKTLYKYVKDKNDLLQHVMKGYCTMEMCAMSDIVNKKLNAIDEIIEIGKHVSQHLKMMHPSILYDMEKYYPEVWTIFEDHKANSIEGCIRDNLNKGIQEGLYRDNLHVEIITKIYLSKIDMIFNPSIFPSTKYNFVEVYTQLVRYHLRGVVSSKGYEYLKNEIKDENLNFYQ